MTTSLKVLPKVSWQGMTVSGNQDKSLPLDPLQQVWVKRPIGWGHLVADSQDFHRWLSA
jgi:hypothetical protein